MSVIFKFDHEFQATKRKNVTIPEDLDQFVDSDETKKASPRNSPERNRGG